MAYGLDSQCGLIFFGVGAAILVDYEETCRRLGIDIRAAVRNRDGECHFSDPRRVIGPDQLTPDLCETGFICPIFDVASRRIAVGEALARGLRPAPPLIDPTSPVASTTQIGVGCYVDAGAVIGAAGRIGDHVVVNRGTGLGHHCRIADFVSIGPGVTIAGHVTIGAGVLIGAGAVLAPKVTIGEGAVIGAGAVVVRDIEAGVVAVGNPARPMQPAR